MLCSRSIRFALLALLFTVGLPGAASAILIHYQASDLVDLVVGQDLWQYSYSVEAHSFDTDYGFSILFDPALYEDLEDPPPAVNADWDILTLQPDVNLPDDGLYDALALADSASLANVFSVTFVYLGAETPGSQPFVLYEPGFNPIATGDTAVIPEPGTATLLGLGLAGLVARSGRRRPSPRAGPAFPTSRNRAISHRI